MIIIFGIFLGIALLLTIRYSDGVLSNWTRQKKWSFFTVQLIGVSYIIGTGVIMYFIPSTSSFLHVLSIAVIVAGILKLLFISGLFVIKVVKFEKFVELSERLEN